MSAITACRICGAKELQPVLNLGETPLANALLRADQLGDPEPRYPLELVRCPRCTLVQITETVDPALLFRHYLYFSSFSEGMARHAAALAARLAHQEGLGANSLVVEIASNDGYLLKYYQSAGVPVLGVEPAVNIAAEANRRGVPTLAEFFDLPCGERLAQSGQLADVIHAHNVLAHVADLHGVAAGMARLLKPGGLVVVETPYVRELIEKTEFDTIYHEHLCYYSLSALDWLFAKHGLTIIDVERTPIHGGSLLVFARKYGEPTAQVREMLAEERRLGLDGAAYYRPFAQKVADLRRDLCSVLQERKAQGQRIAVYGASAKGTTLLHTFGLGTQQLDFVVDRSPFKQGLYTPGTHLPILPVEALLERQPEAVLLLTWNFAEEILRQQAEYRQRGGKFIIPVPEVRVV